MKFLLPLTSLAVLVLASAEPVPGYDSAVARRYISDYYKVRGLDAASGNPSVQNAPGESSAGDDQDGDNQQDNNNDGGADQDDDHHHHHHHHTSTGTAAAATGTAVAATGTAVAYATGTGTAYATGTGTATGGAAIATDFVWSELALLKRNRYEARHVYI